jgi:hypothetical protein
MFVRTHQIDGDGDTVREGTCTFGEHAPRACFVQSAMRCPICGAQLERATNARYLKIHRVVRVLGPKHDGETPFMGSLFPWQTHEFLGCRSCSIGFSALKSPDDPSA